MSPPEKSARKLARGLRRGHFLRCGLKARPAELRRFSLILAGIQTNFSAAQTVWRRTQSRANSSPGNPCKQGKIQGIKCFGASVSQLRRCNKPYLQEMFKPELKTIRDLTGSVFPEPAATETWTERQLPILANLRSSNLVPN